MIKYLMLDKDDITKVCGEIDKKEILKEMTLNELNNCLLYGNRFHYKGKYILVEDEDSLSKTKGVFKDIMICEGKKGIYYANRNGEFFIKYNNGKIRHLTKCMHKGTGLVQVVVGTKTYVAKTLIAKLFIKEYKSSYVVVQKNNDPFDCSVKNLLLISRKTWFEKKKRGQPVGLFEDGKLVKKWDSARKCAKDLFCSGQTINNICNEKKETKMFDVRWI